MRLSLDRLGIGEESELASASCDSDLVEAIVASDERLRRRFGPLFEAHLDQACTLIRMTMATRGGSSPLCTAVELGTSGEFGMAIGDDDDAFELLVQASLRLLFKRGTREKVN